MDPSLAHRFLDLGLVLHNSLDHHPAAESTIATVTLNKDEIDIIFANHDFPPMSIANHHRFFEYVLAVLEDNFSPPSAFTLADYCYTVYIEVVKGRVGTIN